MIARQAQKVALTATLIAVLMILFMHIHHYIQQLPE